MILPKIKRLFVFILILTIFVSQICPQEEDDDESDDSTDEGLDVEEDSSDSDGSDGNDNDGNNGTDGSTESTDTQKSTTIGLTATTTTDIPITAKTTTTTIQTTTSFITKPSAIIITTPLPVPTKISNTSTQTTNYTKTTAFPITVPNDSKSSMEVKNAKMSDEYSDGDEDTEDKEESDNNNNDNNNTKEKSQTIEKSNAKENVNKDNKNNKKSEIEREGSVNNDNNDEDYEEEPPEGTGEGSDYFDEPTREELLKSLIQRTFSLNTISMSDMHNKSADQRWVEFITEVESGLASLMRAITPTALDAFYEIPELSAGCSNSLLRMSNGIQQTQEWAFKMLDSNGKFPTGLLSGTLSSLGAYDQCLETVAMDDNKELFRGQYCILKMRPPMPQLNGRISYHRPVISLNGSKWANTWIDSRIAGRYATGFYSTYIYNALCLPSTCSVKELNAITSKYIGDYFDVSLDYCDHNTTDSNGLSIINTYRGLNVMQRIAIIIIMASIVLVFMGSLVEMFCPDFVKLQSFGRLIACFSIISNTQKLFYINRNKMDKKLTFVHGIRVLTMIWIIAIHTFTVGTLFVPMLIYRFEDEARQFGKQLSTQFIYNGYISVSNFFFLSGLVATYVSIPLFNKSYGPTFFRFISLRWFRFVPSVIGIICFHMLWPLMGSGPVFKQVSQQLTEPCTTNWWTNILFINNWFLLPDMCLVHTWFLSADMQLHMLSFFAILALSKAKSFGIILCTALILCGIGIPSLVNYKTYGPPMPLPFNEPDLDQFYRDLNTLYHPTYNHLSTYFIGVLVGYLLFTRKEIKFSLPSRAFMWIVLPVLTLGATFATYLWTGLDWQYSRLTAATYSGLHRFIYILFYVWIAIYCSQNTKSLLNRFFSSNFFIPLSRLSFSVYLTHILVVWYFVLETRDMIRFTYKDFIYSTGGVIVYTFIISFVLYLLFESVWSNILSLIFKKNQKKNSGNVGDTQNDQKKADIKHNYMQSTNGKDMQLNLSANSVRHLAQFTNGSNGSQSSDNWKEKAVKDINGNSLHEYKVDSIPRGTVFVDVDEGVGALHSTNTHINHSFISRYHSDNNNNNTKL